MVWLSKNLADLCTTLQIISISLYKIVGLYFTDCKNYDKTMSLFLVIVGVIDAFHESFAIVYFIRQGPC
jgi:hypothetical protein